MKGAGDADHVGTTLEKVDEDIVKKALIAYGDLEEGDDFAFTDVVDVVVEKNSGITTINDAFTNRVSGTSFNDKFNEKLKTATLNGITTIGENAFSHCIALTTVTLSENVKVGNAAFDNCWSLSYYGPNDIDFSKITSIGEKAFADCKSLTTVDLSNLSDTSLGENAFNGCEDLTTVTLPKTITHINDSVFRSCYKLSSIDLSHVTYIGTEAFRYCYELLEVNLENAQTIGVSAFQECRKLMEINLGVGPKTIYPSAFYSGSNAEKVTIYYGTQSGNDQKLDEQLLANLTVPDAVGTPYFNNKLEEIGLAYEGKDCGGSYPFGTKAPIAHYESATSYIPSTTAYSIPNPAARFILNL